MKKRFSLRSGKRITAYIMMLVMGFSVISVPATVKADEISDAAVVVDDTTEETDILDIQSEELSSFTIAKGEFLGKLSGSSDSSYTSVKDRNWQKYRTTYVFDQMDAKEKALYNELESVCMDYIKNSSKDAINMGGNYYLPAVSIEAFDDESYVDVLQMFIYSNPQYYFTTMQYGFNSYEKKLFMYCFPSFADGDDRAEVTNLLFDTADEWLSDITDGNTGSINIEKAAHDYICENVSYDYDAADKLADNEYSEQIYQTQTVYSTFTKGATVCAGYSLAYELLLNAAGIPTVATYSDCHAWNKVYLDDCGKWYAVDVTWDDDDKGSTIDYRFYNKSDENIQKYDDASQSHKIKVAKYFPAAYKDFEDSDIIAVSDDNNNDVTPVDQETGDDESSDDVAPAGNDESSDDVAPVGNDESNDDVAGVDLTSQDDSDDDNDIQDEVDNNSGITIYFDTNGGDEIEPLVVKNGDSIVLPKAVRSGYVFDGWYYLGEPIGKSTTINSDVTLVAHWTAIPVQNDSTQVNVSTEADDDDDDSPVEVIEEDDEEEITIDAPGLSKVKAAGSKKCKVTWKKVAEAKGYEIQLSTTKNFKKIAKKVKVSKNSTNVTVKKLKKKTTYYVRVRAYTNVDGDTITSDWSGVKKVTIK